MKSRRLIILFWILLLVPAVIISIAAFRLLLHEQERINQSSITSLTQSAETLAENVHITIKEVEERLSGSLLEIEAEDLESTLVLWEETNPLVRNVFIWEEETLLKYPVKGMASTREERRFISRFDGIFSGEQTFKSLDRRVAAEQPSVKLSSKESLYSLARGKTAAQTSMPAKAAEQRAEPGGSYFTPESGWIPWFAQDQLFILGWVKKTADGPVYGIELELVSVLSRLVVDLPKAENNKFVFAILDSRGQTVHQSGDIENENKEACRISTPLSELLPHWQLCIFHGKETREAGKGFFYVSLLLLFIFLAAIISGGILLTIQTHKHMKDAMQKTSFVSSVSHELKTPLTSIRMYAELMLDKRSVSKEKTAHYLEVMVAQSQRLTRLINNILDFGRLEQNRKKYNKSLVDIREMLMTIIDAHSIRIKKQGFEIETDIKNGDYVTYTDADAVEQVILNLIDNALKYADEGKFLGCRLYNDAKGLIILKIQDRGPGIPRKYRKAVFDKFYRIDNSLTATVQGSGLGLSISRKILRDLGGDLGFEPVKKGGSSFILEIP